MAIGQRVNRSTAVNRYLNPFDLGNVTKSILMCSNRLLGTVKSPMGGVTCRVTLACWHDRHSLAHLLTSSLMDGHTTLFETICRVRSTPGCPKPWRTSKILFRSENGIYGLAGPFEMSTRMFVSPMSTLFQLRPERESRRRRWNSGSNGCKRATSIQSIPRSPIEATTRCRSSNAASFFNEHFDSSTDADAVSSADALVVEVEEVENEAVVVGISRIPPPEAPVGVVEDDEGVDDAEFVDERVGDEFERLGSVVLIGRWG